MSGANMGTTGAPPRRAKSRPSRAAAWDLADKAAAIAAAAGARKALDIVGLDTRGHSSFADTFVLATGTSDRHVRAIADSIAEVARTHGEKPLGTEGYDEGRWVLIDYGDTIVHIFLQEVREHYDLERLWSDAPTIEFDAEADR